jgi:arylsulfatase A-like enzyme
VLLLMADQLRWDALGFMGHPVVRTPHLDRLARDGTMFENAFTPCPVCMASRAAILTGRLPRTLGVPSMGLLPPDEITLAGSLRAAGYRTGLFGKLHLTPQQHTLLVLGRHRPVCNAAPFLEAAGIDTPATRAAVADPATQGYGFDTVAGVEDFLWEDYLDWLAERSPGHLPWALGESWGCRGLAPKYGVEPRAEALFTDHAKDFFASRIPHELHPDEFIVERTLEFVKADPGRPFFALCSFVDPHHPFKAPITFDRAYPPSGIPLPAAVDPARCYPAGLPGGVRAQVDACAAYPTELWQWVLATYYGMISALDASVGRLLDGLREAGLERDTLVVFVTDHGDHAGDHRLLRKGSLLFDSLVRIPLVVAWPGTLPAGRRVSSTVVATDVYPTVMRLAGLPVHDGVQGRDLGPELRGGASAGEPEAVFCELDGLANPLFWNQVYQPAMAIRTRSWKLVHFPTTRAGMLFDLAADPGESENRYDDPACAGIRHEMALRMLDHLHLSRDPLPKRLSQA